MIMPETVEEIDKGIQYLGVGSLWMIEAAMAANPSLNLPLK